ncbi:MAG: response regulator [bacterium]|nr:response regulator [bacterium]
MTIMTKQDHILIVDDEDWPRNTLRRNLAEENRLWKISTAASIEEAKKVVDLGGVDVVLTDLVLGDVAAGGVDLLQIVKKKDKFIMVIIFTAKEKRLDRFGAYQIGAFDCIEKNMLGTSSWQEISAKTKAALYFRKLTLEHLENQGRLRTLRRYFDPRMFSILEQHPSHLDVRLRSAAIAFWDVRNFSTLCNNPELDPHMIRDFLIDYYDLATDTIFDYEGILDKFIGDGVMGIFCDVFHDEDKSARLDAIGRFVLTAQAAKAAIAFRGAFTEMQRKWSARLSSLGRKVPEMGIGCGIHIGDSLIGRFDTKRRDQFTGIGPDVNLSSRLQENAGSGQILLSEAAAELLKGSFDIDYLGVVELKNIGTHEIFQLNREL